MAYKVIIGHLVSDERGTIGSSKSIPGDQTGRESRLQEWYKTSTPWGYVFRPKSKKTADKIASSMETICKMPNLGGYNQTRRTTLAVEARKHNWVLEEIKVPCESDCSASVAVCVNCAGISVSIDMYTGNEKQLLEATNKFKTLTAKKYLEKSSALLRGDILLKKGHTAIVISKQYILSCEICKGASGTDVKQLQQALNDNGVYVPITGKFGSLTYNAVRLYQKEHGLKDDGIVGKNTATALNFAWEG